MRSSLISESGIIGQDGKLRLPTDRLNQFYREHLGERVIVKVEAVGRHSSKALFGYYYGYILPTIRRAFISKGEVRTEEQTHEFLWREWPGEHGWTDDFRQAHPDVASAFIDWLQRYAAENLETYIEDPVNI